DNIGFVAQANTTAVSAFTGDLLIDRTQDLPTPDALHLGSLAAALVYDTSIFGGTSPVRGMSYRFELGGNTGSLTYSTGLADFRRYFMLVRPLTLAGRLLHYGRYGGGAEDSRLQ